jgi:hypothetical protein
VNPLNALLNYLYAILEAEARLAISELGLDPGIGMLHNDTRTRDSLACDLMEPVRPQVDAFVLDWLRRTLLQRKWFFEERNGNCRLTGEFAVQLSETSKLWKQALGPFAEWMLRTLWSVSSSTSKIEAPATRLTQDRKREAKGISTFPVELPISVLDRASHVSLENRAILPKGIRLTASDPIAEKRRAETQRRQNAAIKAWNSSEKPAWMNRRFYCEHLQPCLLRVGVSPIQTALSVSHSYALKICKGMCVPHPRHWNDLAKLCGQQRPVFE